MTDENGANARMHTEANNNERGGKIKFMILGAIMLGIGFAVAVVVKNHTSHHAEHSHAHMENMEHMKHMEHKHDKQRDDAGAQAQ